MSKPHQVNARLTLGYLGDISLCRNSLQSFWELTARVLCHERLDFRNDIVVNRRPRSVDAINDLDAGREVDPRESGSDESDVFVVEKVLG